LDNGSTAEHPLAEAGFAVKGAAGDPLEEHIRATTCTVTFPPESQFLNKRKNNGAAS